MTSAVSTLTVEERESIRRMTEEDWTAAVLARDWHKTLAMCAADVVYMPADHPALRGHAELRAWLDQFPRILTFTQPLESVDGYGDLAISRATFAATVDNSGTPIQV